MELKDTVNLMNSEDYKERLKAEYLQTKIRRDKLHTVLVKKEAGTLDSTLTCSTTILVRQQNAMNEYLKLLEIRAEIEGVELE